MAKRRGLVGSRLVGQLSVGSTTVGAPKGSTAGGKPGAPPPSSFLLLRNGVDRLLLRDGVSKLKLGHQ